MIPKKVSTWMDSWQEKVLEAIRPAPSTRMSDAELVMTRQKLNELLSRTPSLPELEETREPAIH